MDPFELRRLDFSLDEDHEAIQDAFRAFFVKECPTSVVRAAEPLGYDAQLWSKLLALGVTSMPLPAESGGDGAGIVELSLVAEELGRALAPVPLVEHMVASRLLAAAGGADDIVADAMDGSRLLGLAFASLSAPTLVSSAAVADTIVGLDGD